MRPWCRGIRPSYARTYRILPGLFLCSDHWLWDWIGTGWPRGIALRAESKDALAHNNLGMVLHGLGRLQEATAEYRQVLVVAPGHERARGAWPGYPPPQPQNADRVVMGIAGTCGANARPPESRFNRATFTAPAAAGVWGCRGGVPSAAGPRIGWTASDRRPPGGRFRRPNSRRPGSAGRWRTSAAGAAVQRPILAERCNRRPTRPIPAERR